MTDQELLLNLKKFVSHDIVAPLANIKNYFYMLKNRDLSDSERSKILLKIEENNLSALSMINHMKAELKKE